jgi:hypothetical protein
VINYFQLGPNKKLNEIVVAGSHDAGITGGKDNIQTQSRNIYRQAVAGVRVFDLRIAAEAVPVRPGHLKSVELKAYHADGAFQTNETKTRYVDRLGLVPVVRTKLSAGDFGLGLKEMLVQARNFVRSAGGATEFLILKFDKCQNWALIAEACVFFLEDTIYTGGGNLNTTKIGDLQGHVIVLFSGKGVNEAAYSYGPQDGILGFKSLYGDEHAQYKSDFDGLQYFGKGGTSVSPLKAFNKQFQNVTKQRKLLTEAKGLMSPDVIGMMYWTTTGLIESIKTRNQDMWLAPNVQKMKRLWAGGLADIIDYRQPFVVPDGSPAIGPLRKRFMPNIVMIDFADPSKCQIIRDLNDLSTDDLRRLGADI